MDSLHAFTLCLILTLQLPKWLCGRALVKIISIPAQCCWLGNYQTLKCTAWNQIEAKTNGQRKNTKQDVRKQRVSRVRSKKKESKKEAPIVVVNGFLSFVFIAIDYLPTYTAL